MFFAVVPIDAKPLVALRLRSMEYPVMVDWTSLRLVSVQRSSISLVETAAAENGFGADSWAADAVPGKKNASKSTIDKVDWRDLGFMSRLLRWKTPHYPGAG